MYLTILILTSFIGFFLFDWKGFLGVVLILFSIKRYTSLLVFQFIKRKSLYKKVNKKLPLIGLISIISFLFLVDMRNVIRLTILVLFYSQYSNLNKSKDFFS